MSFVTEMMEESSRIEGELADARQQLRESERKNAVLAGALRALAGELNAVATSDPAFWMTARDRELQAAMKRMADYGFNALSSAEQQPKKLAKYTYHWEVSQPEGCVLSTSLLLTIRRGREFVASSSNRLINKNDLRELTLSAASMLKTIAIDSTRPQFNYMYDRAMEYLSATFANGVDTNRGDADS
jgi:hypothetical protein